MRANARLGAAAVADLLGRSAASVRSAAQRQRISLRRRGYRGGLILGQPAGCSLRGALREDVYGGRVDVDLLNERLRIDAEADLCPACGRRPQRVRSTGLCVPCHKERLAEAHREAIAEHEAQKRLWMERQRRHRLPKEPPA